MTTLSNYFIAATIAELACHPISVMKSNYICHGKINFVKNINSNGIMFYYRTSPIIIIKQITSLSCKLSMYKHMQKYYDSTNTFMNFTNSFACYCVLSVIEHPFENVFINKSTNPMIKWSNLKTRLYHGYSTTLCRQIMCSMLLPINDMYKKYFNDHTLTASVLASFTTTIIVHPVDNIRIQIVTNKCQYNNIQFNTVYRGIHLSLIRNICHFSLLSYVYNRLV